MTTKNSKAVMTVADEETLKALDESFPVEAGFTRNVFPRIEMTSQDKTEESIDPKTKKKKIEVTAEAGTFFLSKQSAEEIDVEVEEVVKGKIVKKIVKRRPFEKEEVGTELEGIIVYRRHQLKFFDGEKYTSSPLYDTDDQIIPLWRDKQEVDRGNPAELKSRDIYQGKSAKGKDISKLEDNRVLFVLVNGVLHQLNLRGTSMYAYLKYARENRVNQVVTKFSSIHQENGAIEWNQMTFEAVRPVNQEEAELILEKTKELKEGIEMEKSFLANASKNEDVHEKDMKNMALGSGAKVERKGKDF